MNNVSVPCRGTAFLNVVSTILMIWLYRFRPLSGNCISQSGIVITIAHGSEVSVPCRGTAFLNHIYSSISKAFLLYCFRPLSGNCISQSGRYLYFKKR